VCFEDGEWLGSLKKALLKLWSLFQQCKHEKKQYEELLRKSLEEKEKVVDAKIQIELQAADLIREYK
jgi:hypothetical protein